MVGGSGSGQPRPIAVPKNGLAPSRERGVYTRRLPAPTYLKYMESPNVA